MKKIIDSVKIYKLTESQLLCERLSYILNGVNSMSGKKRIIKLGILVFLFCGFLFQPIWVSVNSKAIFNDGSFSNNQIIDNNEPSNQQPSINNLGAPNYGFTEILVKNSIAYCSYYGYSIGTFDFSNPNERIYLGDYLYYYYYTEMISAMAFYGEYLCIINDYNLSFTDISQPANLTIRSTYALNLTYNHISSLRIKNNIGYITGFMGQYNNESEYVRVSFLTLINYNNLDNPIIGEYQNEILVREASYNGNYAYLMHTEWDEKVNGFEIIDFSDPANPFLIGEWQGECLAWSIKAVNNHLFLSTDKGLMVFDVSDPSNPQKINVYKKHLKMRDIFIDGNLAYVTFDNGLIIFDITNPEHLVKVGRKKISFDGNGDFSDLVVENDIVYALRQSEFKGREIYIFDVSNPSYPKKLYPLGVKIGHETVFYTIMILMWVGIPAVIITAIVVPIVVVRKRRKKRRIESKEKIKEAMGESTSQEEPITESATIK